MTNFCMQIFSLGDTKEIIIHLIENLDISKPINLTIKSKIFILPIKIFYYNNNILFSINPVEINKITPKEIYLHNKIYL